MESDFDFVVQRYFSEISLTDRTITDREYHAQRKLITDFFGYRQWSGSVGLQLDALAAQIVRRDITPRFAVAELICWLNEQKLFDQGIPHSRKSSVKHCQQNGNDWRIYCDPHSIQKHRMH